MVMLFLLTLSSISCPSCLQVHHFTQAHNGILPSFRGPNWLIASQHRPLQFPTYCKMLAKCCIYLFSCHLCQTVIFLPYIFLFSFTDTEWRQHFIFVLPCQKSQANKQMVILWQNRGGKWGDFSFVIPSASTARLWKGESTSSLHASITGKCTHTPVCGSIGLLSCDWLTNRILQKVSCRQRGECWPGTSVKHEICLLCATAPVCMFCFLVCLIFVWCFFLFCFVIFLEITPFWLKFIILFYFFKNGLTGALFPILLFQSRDQAES